MRGSAFGRENNKGGYVQGYLTSRQFFSATVKSELPALEMLSQSVLLLQRTKRLIISV